MRFYWLTWLVLLAFTLVMLWLDSLSIARPLFIGLMVIAMLAKASIIAANFMHLRFERLALVLMIVIGLLGTGVVLYVLMAPDAQRIHQMLEAERS